MVLQRLGGSTLGVKSGSTVVQLKDGGVIQIQDRMIDGPGEYDIAGIGIHAFADYAILFAEGIRLAIIWGGSDKIVLEEEDSNTDIFIFLLSDPKQIAALVKEQDPRLVVLPNEEVATALTAEDAVTVAKESNYKLSAQSLPSGEREYLLLT